MTEKLDAFLDEEIVYSIQEAEHKTKRVCRVCELWVVNGFNFEVKSWGTISSTDNIYGRFGLTMVEALELIRYESFLLGMRFKEDAEQDAKWFDHLYSRLTKTFQEETDKQSAMSETEESTDVKDEKLSSDKQE